MTVPNISVTYTLRIHRPDGFTNPDVERYHKYRNYSCILVRHERSSADPSTQSHLFASGHRRMECLSKMEGAQSKEFVIAPSLTWTVLTQSCPVLPTLVMHPFFHERRGVHNAVWVWQCCQHASAQGANNHARCVTAGVHLFSFMQKAAAQSLRRPYERRSATFRRWQLMPEFAPRRLPTGTSMSWAHRVSHAHGSLCEDSHTDAQPGLQATKRFSRLSLNRAILRIASLANHFI